MIATDISCSRLQPDYVTKTLLSSVPDAVYEVCPVSSAYSKTPRTTICKAHTRSGAVVTACDQVVVGHNALVAKVILDDSKAEKGWFGRLRRK